jgi:hypothetical protein
MQFLGTEVASKRDAMDSQECDGIECSSAFPPFAIAGLAPSMFASRSHEDQNPAGPNL